MAKKKVLKKKKVKMKLETKPIEESTQMSEAIAEEITNKCCEAPVEKHFDSVVLKSNHMRQSEINNRVQLVMSFNPQISRNGNGEWSCCIGYDNEKGLFTVSNTALGAVLEMFNKLV